MALLLAMLLASPARADDRERVADLTHTLASPSDKTRLAAVLALAKLGTPPVQPPLTTALHDTSARVRAVAATALGRLGCLSALPALRALSTDDPDESVRQAASNAAIKLAQTPPPMEKADASARRVAAPSRGRADEVHPDLYLLVASSTDDSPGTTDKATRKAHAEILHRVLIELLNGEASVTSGAADARRWGLAARHIDLSVTTLDTVRAGSFIEVRAELRIAISDDQGKLQSFLTGGAKVQVPAAKFDMQYVPQQRREVLESAMRGMFNKLMAHLRKPPN